MKERHLEGCSEYTVNMDDLPIPPWGGAIDRYLNGDSETTPHLTGDLRTVTVTYGDLPPALMEFLAVTPGVEIPQATLIMWLAALTRSIGLSNLVFNTCDLRELEVVFWTEEALRRSRPPQWCHRDSQSMLGMWCWQWVDRLKKVRALDVRLTDALTDALQKHRTAHPDRVAVAKHVADQHAVCRREFGVKPENGKACQYCAACCDACAQNCIARSTPTSTRPIPISITEAYANKERRRRRTEGDTKQ